MVPALMALADLKGRQLYAEMAYLEADVQEELYMKLPHGKRRRKNQFGRPQKAMYGLAHVGLLWSKAIGAELKARGFETSQEDRCVFRRQREGNAVVIIMVYLDDLLLLKAIKEDEKKDLEDLRLSSPIEVLGEIAYYLRRSITRNVRRAR